MARLDDYSASLRPSGRCLWQRWLASLGSPPTGLLTLQAHIVLNMHRMRFL